MVIVSSPLPNPKSKDCHWEVNNELPQLPFCRQNNIFTLFFTVKINKVLEITLYTEYSGLYIIHIPRTVHKAMWGLGQATALAMHLRLGAAD